MKNYITGRNIMVVSRYSNTVIMIFILLISLFIIGEEEVRNFMMIDFNILSLILCILLVKGLTI